MNLNVSSDKKQAVMLIWVLATTILSAYGFITPQQVMTTAQILEALESAPPDQIAGLLQIVLNSSFSLLQKPYDYIISKVGSYTCRQDGANGKLDGYGTSASSVIQSAITALTNGKIFFKIANYTCSSALTVSKTQNIVLEGEMFGKYPQRSQGCILFKAFNGDLITFEGDVSNKNPFQIRNLGFNGGGEGVYTGDIIVANYRRFFQIEDTIIYETGGRGIYLNNCGAFRIRYSEVSEFRNGAGVELNACADWQIYGLECNVGYATSDSSENGLTITGGGGEIVGGHFEGYKGIYSTSQIMVSNARCPWSYVDGIHSSAWGNSIIGCTIVDGNNGDLAYGSGIRVGSQSTVIGNYVAGTHFAYGIYSYGDTRIISNTFGNMGGATEIVRTGQGDIIKDNYGFVTENYVTFSSISNGTYVAHGCAGTPDYVTVTLSVQGYAWYGTKNSTHCQLYFSVATASGTAYFVYEP